MKVKICKSKDYSEKELGLMMLKNLKGEHIKLWYYMNLMGEGEVIELNVSDCNELGMKKDAYYAAKKVLEEKGYLEKEGNGEEYIFYNVRKEKKEPVIKKGIYGIYKNGELVYIGKTVRNFEERWKEHENFIRRKSDKLYVYSLFEEGDEVEFKVLVDMSEGYTEGDISAAENGMIAIYKPVGNVAGKEVSLGGRPQSVNYMEVEKLRGLGWTYEKIANELKCSKSSIEKYFSSKKKK